MRARSRIATYLVSALIITQSLWCTTTQAGRHAFDVGDKVPEFSATTLSGQVFSFKHNKGKALMVVFLSPGQKRSARAAADVEKIVRQLETNAERLQIVIAVDDSNGVDFSTMQKDPAKNVHVLLDSEYKLWGKFGIIATPTVVISDTNDKVLCVKAGYGYDFVPVVRAYINQSAEAALELGELFCRAGRSKAAIDTTKSLKVTKRSDKARLLMVSGWAKRQMGELDAAEKLLLEATKLDPKSTRTLFELGKVYQSRQEINKAMKSYHKALTVIFNE